MQEETMTSNDDTSTARAILGAASMLVITVLGVTWAVMVDQPKLLGLVLVVVLILALFAYVGVVPERPSRDRRADQGKVEL
jgi:membrane protein YdbS with pleckstrin-like domain